MRCSLFSCRRASAHGHGRVDKNVWIDKNRRLWARTLNIPINGDTPPNFPPMTLAVMRHLAALSEIDGRNQTRLLQALDALYEGFWVRHEETFKPEVFQPILQKVLGADDAARVSEAAGKEGKAALARNTEQAFNEKAFGLPWMVCTNSKGETESFWGVDHLGQVAAFLGLEKPGSGGWKALL
jgi:2-hydroxychromene-2-carboxylate isomerase